MFVRFARVLLLVIQPSKVEGLQLENALASSEPGETCSSIALVFFVLFVLVFCVLLLFVLVQTLFHLRISFI